MHRSPDQVERRSAEAQATPCRAKIGTMPRDFVAGARPLQETRSHRSMRPASRGRDCMSEKRAPTALSGSKTRSRLTRQIRSHRIIRRRDHSHFPQANQPQINDWRAWIAPLRAGYTTRPLRHRGNDDPAGDIPTTGRSSGETASRDRAAGFHPYQAQLSRYSRTTSVSGRSRMSSAHRSQKWNARSGLSRFHGLCSTVVSPRRQCPHLTHRATWRT